MGVDEFLVSTLPRKQPPHEDFGEKYRIVRGGAFNYSRDDVRCANRDRDAPDDFSDSVGFRVVSPGFLNAEY